jgi:hypothetical protein
MIDCDHRHRRHRHHFRRPPPREHHHSPPATQPCPRHLLSRPPPPSHHPPACHCRLTCSNNVNSLFPSPAPAGNALAIPNKYCCSACAVAEGVSSDVPPSQAFSQCAAYGQLCNCTGTVYFGEPGSQEWSEAPSDGTGLACTTDNFGNTAVDAAAGTAACYCGGYSYTGCYDDVVVRPLETFVVGNAAGLSSTNVDSCITTCRNSGAPYIALQNSDMCFCTYGFPASAALSDGSKCASRCGETSLVVYNCGGVFANSLYAIAADPYNCTNGVQDGGEGGVDCGGKCATPCGLVVGGSFETIATTSTSVVVSPSAVAAASAWTVSASGSIVRSGASAFGGGQAAPDGLYYFAFPGLTKLTQQIAGISSGYMVQLRFFAAASSTAGDAPTVQVRSGSPALVDEVQLTATFKEYTSSFNIYATALTLQLSCNAGATTYCLIDAVSLVVVATCDDATGQALTLYSSAASSSGGGSGGSSVGSCAAAVRAIEDAGLTCASNTADLFKVPALASPDKFCCGTCASEEGNKGVPMPSSEYALCAYEEHQCLCDGTIYFGAAGWGDWATEISDGSPVSCTTAVFGDPAEGLTNRACYCQGTVSYSPAKSDYLGCFAADAVQDYGVYISAFHNVSLSVCMTMCVHRDYAFFAVSFGNECYCSNGYPKSAVASAESNCATPCAGDPTQICGGDLFLSMCVRVFFLGGIRAGLSGRANARVCPRVCVCARACVFACACPPLPTPLSLKPPPPHPHPLRAACRPTLHKHPTRRAQLSIRS